MVSFKIVINCTFIFKLFLITFWLFRGIRQKVFSEKGALRNCVKLTGKHLCHSLFFDRVAAYSPFLVLVSYEFLKESFRGVM